MKQAYQVTKFRSEALELIEQANRIIEERSAQGYELTLRGLYYQLVTKNVIPNNQREYNRLGEMVSKARRSGLIDWDAINDRTRFLRKSTGWKNPQAIIDTCVYAMRVDPWESQTAYVEAWFEKDALLSVFEVAAREYRVPIFSCRGYASDSEIWRAAQRLQAKDNQGKQVTILHFGDHDPSGLDMTRDIQDRLKLFSENADIEVKRMALNMSQIEEHNPPPNPAKETDSRFGDYRLLHGESSWELDALDPQVIDGIMNEEIKMLVDQYEWDKSIEREHEYQQQIRKVSKNWDEVVGFVKKLKG